MVISSFYQVINEAIKIINKFTIEMENLVFNSRRSYYWYDGTSSGYDNE